AVGGGAIRLRDAVIEAEQILVRGRLVVDDDRHVLEQPGDVGRERVDRLLDVPLEQLEAHSFSTSSVSPSIAVTRTLSPARTSLVARASQISPSTSTWPPVVPDNPGSRVEMATPCIPTIVSTPTVARRRRL